MTGAVQEENMVSMQHTIVGPTLANCGVTIGQRSKSLLFQSCPNYPFANNGLRLGLREFIIHISIRYPPTMAQKNYFLLIQQCFKIVNPPLAHYWHAIHHFPKVSTIYQRWPNYLCYLGMLMREAEKKINSNRLPFIFAIERM